MKEKLTPHIIAVMAFVVFIVLGLACASAPEPSASESAKNHYERGERFAEERNWYRAIQEYSQAIELNPNFTDAYINRAYAYYQEKNYDQAEADCNKAIDLDPNNFKPYYYRGPIYHTRGGRKVSSFITTKDDLTKAIEYYDHALSDYTKALELCTVPDVQQFITKQIDLAKTEKEKIETSLATVRAREEANKYDPSKFTVIPSNFTPSDYTSIDIFKAVSSSKDLRIASNKDEAIVNQMRSMFTLGGGNYILYYVSDLKFVRQSGTDITFSSDDNAITQIMSIDQRAGLQAGQKVRVYYEITRSPLTTWDVIAIEKR